jgi:arylformamidase
MLGAAAAMVTTSAFADGCQVGPPQHHKGPLVFMDYDQLELDASYDQVYYEPLIARVSQRLNSNSDTARAHVGAPQQAAYGPAATGW